MRNIDDSYVIKCYVEDKDSIHSIAKRLGTYPNKIRRILIKYNVKLRSKSEAQKQALKSGRHTHPTKGKKRSSETKFKISESVYDYWQNMSDEDYERRQEIGRELWNKMSEAEKKSLRKAASKGMREAAKHGSKIEQFLKKTLSEHGYTVLYHKKGLIINEDLELDMFIPQLRTAIEIDGPSHFLPIWGEERLKKHIRSDANKTGLLLSEGYVLIRVKYMCKNLSNKTKRQIAGSILESLDKISNKFPDKDDRLIELEVE